MSRPHSRPRVQRNVHSPDAPPPDVHPTNERPGDIRSGDRGAHTQGPRPAFAGTSGWIFSVTGILFLGLSLLWPRVFFPLIWVALFLLLDPINEKWGAPSLLAQRRGGNLRGIFILGASGLLCRILWERLNSLARASWSYSLHRANGTKIFEMPILGYLGFPFFALEAFSVSVLAVTLWNRSSKPLKIFLFMTLPILSLGMCSILDQRTLTSFV